MMMVRGACAPVLERFPDVFRQIGRKFRNPTPLYFVRTHDRDGNQRPLTHAYDYPEHADAVARMFANQEYVSAAVVDMPDGTTRIYQNPNPAPVFCAYCKMQIQPGHDLLVDGDYPYHAGCRSMMQVCERDGFYMTAYGVSRAPAGAWDNFAHDGRRD